MTGIPNPEPGLLAMRSTHRSATRDAWTIQGSYNGIGPHMAANLLVHAGGRAELPMDYLAQPGQLCVRRRHLGPDARHAEGGLVLGSSASR